MTLNPFEAWAQKVEADIRAAVEKDLGALPKLSAAVAAAWPIVQPLLAKVNWSQVLAAAGLNETELQTLVNTLTSVLNTLKSV